jgi:hypothetical protein
MSVPRPTLLLTGGCSCGAIRHEVVSFPPLLYTCNCTDCQIASGGFRRSDDGLARDVA